jgi:pyruvate/2-oxoglutarate/acetoin dehydrogenase E1 component
MALEDAMAADPSVLILGEDVAIPNGPFGATKGLHARYPDRVLDTPISESAMIGATLGMAIAGLRPVVEIMYADFLMVAMDQVVNQVANTRYVSNSRMTAPLVIRTQQGSTPGSCAQHSQSLEAMLAHVPGLRIAIPATPADAYAMNMAAIQLNDPVVVLESRRLYPTKGLVRRGGADAGVGKAEVVRPGTDVTVVTWGTARAWAEQAAAELQTEGIDGEVIDLRWIAPWDQATVIDSARRTGRLVVVHEAVRTGGFGAEIVSTVAEALGSRLRACARVGTADVPIPAAPVLSAEILPSPARIRQAIMTVIQTTD